MRFDNLYLYAMINELAILNIGARIEKIHQPTQHEVIINLRTANGNKKLLLSIHPETFRIHWSERSFENPKQPKAFCVVLRKYLEGGKLLKIEQLHQDRIVKITVESYDAIGDLKQYSLYLELMGKHSNLILVDEQGMILDSFKHIDITQSTYREIIPKRKYILPERSCLQTDPNFPFFLQPLLKQWLSQHEYKPHTLLLHAKNPKGYYYHNPQTKKSTVCFMDIATVFSVTEQAIESLVFPTLSEAMDTYYYQLTNRQQLQEKTSSLLQFVQSHEKKNQRKLKKLEKELTVAVDYEKYQQIGNLILTQQYKISERATEIALENYYNDPMEIIIVKLNPQLDASQNAQSYFKKYTKGKIAITKIAEQIAKTQAEIAYFETITQSLAQADLQQATEIRHELEQQNYLRIRRQKQKQLKPQLQYTEFTYNGVAILVGRNNLQNDYVTFKKKRKGFTWLHVKDAPGSHILICSLEASSEVIEAAALLAAYYSKVRESENVAVDYTLVQNVSKPSGAKPGFVIYKEQKTTYVTPNLSNMLSKFPKHTF